MKTTHDLNLSEGKLEIRAGEKQFTLTNLRYYNWEQEAAEKAFDAQSNIVREAVADKNSQGLVVDISADYYNEGDTVPYIKNGSPLDVHLKGEFETQHDTAAIIKTIEGKKAFAFTGKESTEATSCSQPLSATTLHTPSRHGF